KFGLLLGFLNRLRRLFAGGLGWHIRFLKNPGLRIQALLFQAIAPAAPFSAMPLLALSVSRTGASVGGLLLNFIMGVRRISLSGLVDDWLLNMLTLCFLCRSLGRFICTVTSATPTAFATLLARMCAVLVVGRRREFCLLIFGTGGVRFCLFWHTILN